MLIRNKETSDFEPLLIYLKGIDKNGFIGINTRPGGAEGLARRLIGTDNLIIAEDEGKIVGQMAYLVRKNTIILNLCSVASEYRRTNLLYRMAKFFMNDEICKYAEKIFTGAHSHNDECIRTLQKAGFSCIGFQHDSFFPNTKFMSYQADVPSLRAKYFR